MTIKSHNHRPCKKCGETKHPRAICVSPKCAGERKCPCGAPILRSRFVRCVDCQREFKREYTRYYRAKKNPNKKPKTEPKGKRCKDCPSFSHFGKCGAITSGPMQSIPAAAVRISGNCPREHGLRDCLRNTRKIIPMRYNDHQKTTAGVTSSVYIDPIPAP